MIVVSNAGPLIALAKISQLPLLQALFGEVVIPEEVQREIVVRGRVNRELRWLHALNG